MWANHSTFSELISARAAVARLRLEEAQEAGLSCGTMDVNYKEIQQAAFRLNAAEHNFCLQQVEREDDNLTESFEKFGEVIQTAQDDQLVQFPTAEEIKEALFVIGP
ncbi:hypothetical protein ZIOFF_072739 [Zingiber officinale]|uniref:Uncharacterized protein n=1 Tax=Zingiber officinale TaxID=94328 RepID=A0A8J5BVB3_ZINOF|nr:hypothetical protein ZIOFF_072739 [Zingiber officinale]